MLYAVTVKVIDGMTGEAVPNAKVASVITDSTGQSTVTFTSPGFYSLMAYRSARCDLMLSLLKSLLDLLANIVQFHVLTIRRLCS